MRTLSKHFQVIFFISTGAVIFLLWMYFIRRAESSSASVVNQTPAAVFSSQLKAAKYRGNPIFSRDSVTEKLPSLAAGNCLIKNQGETVLFYYSHFKDSTAVFSTRSKDGYHFEPTNSLVPQEPLLKPGNDGDWDDGGVSVLPDCMIKKKDGTYLMYYTGSRKNGVDLYHTGQIGIATSKDLLHWTKHPNNPILRPSGSGWEGMGVFEPSIYFTGNEYGAPQSYQMWYGGSDKNLRFQIGYAESIDGINWKRPSVQPVLSYSNQPDQFDNYSIEVHSVAKRDNGYLLFYEAVQHEFPNRFAIGVAYSLDGRKWKKHQQNPILEAGPVGSWDQMGVYHPAFIVDDDRYLLYFVGLDSIFSHRLGVAELNPGVIDNLSLYSK